VDQYGENWSEAAWASTNELALVNFSLRYALSCADGVNAVAMVINALKALYGVHIVTGYSLKQEAAEKKLELVQGCFTSRRVVVQWHISVALSDSALLCSTRDILRLVGRWNKQANCGKYYKPMKRPASGGRGAPRNSGKKGGLPDDSEDGEEDYGPVPRPQRSGEKRARRTQPKFGAHTSSKKNNTGRQVNGCMDAVVELAEGYLAGECDAADLSDAFAQCAEEHLPADWLMHANTLEQAIKPAMHRWIDVVAQRGDSLEESEHSKLRGDLDASQRVAELHAAVDRWDCEHLSPMHAAGGALDTPHTVHTATRDSAAAPHSALTITDTARTVQSSPAQPPRQAASPAAAADAGKAADAKGAAATTDPSRIITSDVHCGADKDAGSASGGLPPLKDFAKPSGEISPSKESDPLKSSNVAELFRMFLFSLLEGRSGEFFLKCSGKRKLLV
jgi:hypothetical protein